MLKTIHKYLLVCLGTTLFVTSGHTARIMNNNPIKEDWDCKIVDGTWSCHRAENPTNVFSKDITTNQKNKALADDLGWVPDSSYFVEGYYSNDSRFTQALCESKKTDLSYENAEYTTDGTLIANGNVEVLQCDQELYGDNAIVNFNTEKNAIESLVMTGNVVAKQPSTGLLIRTTDMDATLEDGNYSSGRTYFRMARETPGTRIYNKKEFSGHIRGYADSFKKQDNNILIEDGYITSGGPYDNDWKISGKNIDIDIEDEMAYIKDGFFKVKDIPVMYIPYMSHPIGTKRRSGFLFPTLVNNERSGNGISIPYYFNLAPNYDLLLDTVVWADRGIMENGTFRYMTDYFTGEVEGSFLPYDFKTNSAMRGAFTIKNSGDFKNGITTNLAYDYVTDEQYYNDFSAGNINLVTKTLLDREFDVKYSNDNINSSIQLLNYGLVNQLMKLNDIPYGKLPEIRVSGNTDGYTPQWLSLQANTINTYFYKTSHAINPSADPKTGNPNLQGTNVNAFRGYESPKIQGNFNETWGYLNPSLEVPVRYYQLNNKATDTIQFSNGNATSVLPIFNIDAAAYFDKEYTTKDGAYTQTIKPRLFYTYIPYQNQNNLPIFDTNYQNMQYMQMFQVNRFTGYDRINNANQITYALESSTLNQADGSTLASAKIGQMYYMADRMVNMQQGANAGPFKPIDPFYNESFSPITSSFEYQIVKNIYLSAQINYRVKQNNFDYQIYKLQYKDENENLFNISYNNIANNWNALTQDQINQGVAPIAQQTVTLSTLYNITDTWGIATLWNYNFQQEKVSNMFAGVQYNAKSWALRALVEATAYTNENPSDTTTLGNLNNTYILEFELKGIGSVGGSSNLSSQLQQIAGYETGMWGEGI